MKLWRNQWGSLHLKPYELKGGELFYFAGIDEARFKRPVLPGDQMELNVQVIKERRGITAFTGIATVNGEVACEAKLMMCSSIIKEKLRGKYDPPKCKNSPNRACC